MNIIVFDNCIVFPANKIVSVYIDSDNIKRVVVWLEDGFTHELICKNKEDAIDTFNTIKQAIKEL